MHCTYRYFIAAAFFISLHALAQQAPCGFDFMHPHDVAIVQSEEQVNRILYGQEVNRAPGSSNRLTVLNIPVVVHIIHQNGAENIPDAVITAAIDETNLRFANAAPFYDSTGVDLQIQLCLASVDPYGNPTTGITRTVSPYTELFSFPTATDFNLKNLDRWEPHLYLNIWVVKSMTGVNWVGYSNYPSYAGTWTDGVVVIYNYFNGPILAHEIGHYLGLYHTFAGGCLNDNRMLDGDMVCDTPPDSSYDFLCPNNTCTSEMADTSGFNPFTTDQADLPNYMDYTTCRNSFSAGQSSRMNNSLTLLRATLLQSNGCGQNPGGVIPVASFTHDTVGCPKNTFINTSLNSLGAQWDFTNDGLIDNAGDWVQWQFPGPGYYTVTMYAAGYGGIDSVTQVVYVQAPYYNNYPLQNMSGVTVSLFQPGFSFCLGSTVTLTAEPGMVSYLWSTGDTTQVLSIVPSSTFSISLTAIDTAGLIWNTCIPATASPVPAGIPPVLTPLNNDTAYCLGDTITMLATYSPLVLFTNWYTPQGILANYFDSSYQCVAGLFNTFFINQIDSNGCLTFSATITLQGDYHALTGNIAQNGDTLNYSSALVFHYRWYLDGIPIPNSDTVEIVAIQSGCYRVKGWYTHEECGTMSPDSVCITVSGIEGTEALSHQLSVFPNPADDEITVSNNQMMLDEIKLRNVLGEEVITLQNIRSKIATLNLKRLDAGIYFLEINTRQGSVNRKINVMK